ncbi:MAG: O-antigen ligase family protein [Nitrospirota bacterium]
MRSDAKPMATPELKPWAIGQPRRTQESKAGFYLVLAYLLFEFGRPQELIPGVRGIPFSTGLSVLILLNVLMSGKSVFSRLQTKLWLPLFVLMAIHVPIAVNNFWALMTLKDMFLLYCVYLGIVTFVDSLEKMMTLMKMWLGIHVFLAVMGIAKGGVGIGSWMGDENDFCMVMNMAIPFAYFLLFAATKAKEKQKYLAFLGVFILAAMASLSRGGFIGLASVGAYCWYRSPKKLNALIVVVVAVLFMLVLAPEKYWDEIASSTSEQTMGTGTGANRLYLWGIGMEMFYSNPIIGVGQQNFPWTFEIYEAGRTFDGRSVAGRQAHNAWVTLIAELGLSGTLIIGVMIVRCFMDLKLVRTSLSPARSSQKHGQTIQQGEDVRVYLARAMEGSLIGFIVSGVFISILWYPSLWIMMALVVALRNISEVERGDLGPDAVRSRYQMGVLLPKLGGKPLGHLAREYQPNPIP